MTEATTGTQAGRRRVAACPACACADHRRLVRVVTPYAPPWPELVYLHCARCGLVYAEQVLASTEALDEAYVTPYRAVGESEFVRDTARRRALNVYRKAWLDERLAALGRPLAHRDALEIGAKDGSFLSLLRQDGWKVLGIDPNRPYAAWAKRHYGIAIEAGYFQAGAYAGRRFGLVAAFLLLEHVADPAAFLGAVRSVLQEGGLVYLETPNLAHIQQRQLIPTHPILYSARSLRQTMEHGGFRIVAETDMAPGGMMTFDQLAVLAEPEAAGAPQDWQLADRDDEVRPALERALRDDFPNPPVGMPHWLFQAACRVLGEPAAGALKRWYRLVRSAGTRQRLQAGDGNGAAGRFPEPIRAAAAQGFVAAGHLEALAGIAEERLQLRILSRIMAYRLSPSATRQLIAAQAAQAPADTREEKTA